MQDLDTVLQIQPRKPALDDAGYTAPTQQHEPDHTDHTDHTDHNNLSALKDKDHTDQIYCPEISTSYRSGI